MQNIAQNDTDNCMQCKHSNNMKEYLKFSGIQILIAKCC